MKNILLILLVSVSVPVTALADIDVVNINSINKDGFQAIKFRNVENTCDYYGEIQVVKENQKVIIVKRKICGKNSESVKLYAQSDSPINLDAQFIPAGSKWTLR